MYLSQKLSFKVTKKLGGVLDCIQVFFIILFSCYFMSPNWGHIGLNLIIRPIVPGRVAQSVGHLTHKSGVLGSIPGLATYFRFSFRFFKKDSCQLLAKVCARSTG